MRAIPVEWALFLGKRLGDVLYYFDCRHKTIAYANIKAACAGEYSTAQVARTTRNFYQHFGQNLIEIFFIPAVNKDYLKKYISFEGLEHIDQGFQRGKGVILLGAHEGSWELSNIICANLGFVFIVFVQGQRFPRMNRLLNYYRSSKGCKIIQRPQGLRQLIEALKQNHAVGMTVDQGGKNGILVDFLGGEASMSPGAVRFALKYDATIVPAFYKRTQGPHIKVIIDPPFQIERTGDLEEDVRRNLQRLVRIYEKNIRRYPEEYLWTYKIWKYGKTRKILILSDGKTGHLRQSQAVAGITTRLFAERGLQATQETIEVKYKSNLARKALAMSTCLSGKYHCQGCLWCVRTFLEPGVYQALQKIKPEVIISSGAQVAPLAYLLARENAAKSIVVMRPSLLSTRRFDLVVMPRHDHPPRRGNIVTTVGALNLVDQEYLNDQRQKLLQNPEVALKPDGFYIGVLIGGDAKKFRLSPQVVSTVMRQIKSAALTLGADILVTTSRRTSKEVVDCIKGECEGHPRCRLLVIAHEKNIPEAVGGILGLSSIVVTSPESISMVSEAMQSNTYVFTFKAEGLIAKHQRFLDYCIGNNYLFLSRPDELARAIVEIGKKKPAVHSPRDTRAVRDAISRIL